MSDIALALEVNDLVPQLLASRDTRGLRYFDVTSILLAIVDILKNVAMSFLVDK